MPGIESILEEIGLSKRESKLYLALLELGSTTVGPLQKKSGIPSSKIYEILEKLINRGLASYVIVSGRKNFQASDPEEILAIIDERRRILSEVMPQLKLKQQRVKEKQSVEIFEGINAMRGLFINLLRDAKKGEDWYGFTSSKFNEPVVQRFYLYIGALRLETGVNNKLLVPKPKRKLFEETYKDGVKFLKKQKMLRYSTSFFPGDVAIFRDNIVIIDWSETPTAILIKSDSVAEQYKKFFEQFWKRASI